MTKADREKKIAKLMKSLNIDRAEAEQVCDDDDEVDKMTVGQINATLTPEQKKVQKENTKTGTKKTTVYKFDTASKIKKKDAEKEDFIAKLHGIIAEFTENCEIANPNREITFNLGENSYSLVLTKHGNKKK